MVRSIFLVIMVAAAGCIVPPWNQGTVEIPVIIVESAYSVTPASGDAEEWGLTEGRFEHCQRVTIGEDVRIHIAPKDEVPGSLILHRFNSDSDGSYVGGIGHEIGMTFGTADAAHLLPMFDGNVLGTFAFADVAELDGHVFHPGAEMATGPTYQYQVHAEWYDGKGTFDVAEQIDAQYLGIIDVHWERYQMQCD